VPVAPPEHDWVPRPLPTDAQLLADALLERATVPAEIVRGVRATLRGPRHVAGRAARALGGIGAMARVGLQAAPSSSLNVRIGPHRRFTWVRADLAEFKAVKNALGGTVNDVVLAAVAGALGRYLRMHGEATEDLVLKAMVPVSVRADVERGALGNRVAAMWAPLPIGVTDPVQRLLTISREMDGIKQSGQAVGAQVLTELTGFAPPTIMAQAARLQARQRMFNLVVTNVPGPQIPLYMLGRRLESMFPMVPLAENQALGVAIMSYNGSLDFGLNADYDALGDLEALAEELRASIEELVAAAGESAPSRSRSSHGARPAGRRTLRVAE
jgi:WS/DGAT/MGAT family acyltransferase